MPLHAGSRVGPYEITAEIGAGGMGSARGPCDEPAEERARVGVGPHELWAML
jgi:hypothetical protein